MQPCAGPDLLLQNVNFMKVWEILGKSADPTVQLLDRAILLKASVQYVVLSSLNIFGS